MPHFQRVVVAQFAERGYEVPQKGKSRIAGLSCCATREGSRNRWSPAIMIKPPNNSPKSPWLPSNSPGKCAWTSSVVLALWYCSSDPADAIQLPADIFAFQHLMYFGMVDNNIFRSRPHVWAIFLIILAVSTCLGRAWS